jgi:hypothetical protein
MKINSSIRWALVTFSLGVSCGIAGHYLPGEMAFMAVIILSFVFSVVGALAIQDEEKP